MPPKTGKKKPDSLGSFFGRTDALRVAVGHAFQGERRRSAAPRVWEFDRASLALLRGVLERHGWPVEADPKAALLAAQRAGDLECGALVDRYGADALARGFIILPAFDGDRAPFRCEQAADTLRVLPSGADGTVSRDAVPPVPMACLYFPFAGPQEDFHAAVEFEVLFGGAKGGSKTEAIVSDAARYVEHPAYKGLITRKTLMALAEIIRRTKALYGTEGDPNVGLGGSYNESTRTFTFPSGALIELGFLETEEDAERYQGREPTRVYCDEAAQIGRRKVFSIIRAEIRSPDHRLRLAMRYTANPIGAGVPFLKKRFLDVCGNRGERVYVETVLVEGETVEMDRRFIPSKVTDNPVLRRNKKYMGVLLTLPEGQRRLLLDGDWTAAQGGYYGDLDQHKHIVPAYEIPSYARLVAGFDWGFAHRWALVIGYRDREGRLILVDTLWGRQDQPEDVAARFLHWQSRGLPTIPPHRKLGVIWSSPGLFDRRAEAKQGALTRAQEFAAAGVALLEGSEDAGSRERKGGTVRRLLAWKAVEGDEASGIPPREEKEPLMVMMDTPGNRILFGQLELMVPDDTNPEEPLKVDYDDSEVDLTEGVRVNYSGDDGQDALWFLADTDRSSAPAPKAAKARRDTDHDGEYARVVRAHTRPVMQGGWV